MSQFPSGRQAMMQLGSEMGFLRLGVQESRPVWAAHPTPRGVSLSVFVRGDWHLAFLHVALPWTWRLFPAHRRRREQHELSAAAAPLWAHCTSPSGACSRDPGRDAAGHFKVGTQNRSMLFMQQKLKDLGSWLTQRWGQFSNRVGTGPADSVLWRSQ